MLIREKLVIDTEIGFSVNSGNNFVNFEERSSRRTIVILKKNQMVFSRITTQNNYLRSSSKKAEIVSKMIEGSMEKSKTAVQAKKSVR